MILLYMAVIGIDEAGRGPVLGSMFIGAVKVESMDELSEEIDDSKNLSISKIRELSEEHTEIEHTTIEVTANDIDGLNNKSLSSRTIEAMAEAVNDLGYTDSDSIIADSCYKNTERFADEFLNQLRGNPFIIAENGADDSYPVVGMASIFAKENREDHMDILNENAVRDLGSGYPSDPTTREYLEKISEAPEFVRESWSTSEDLL